MIEVDISPETLDRLLDTAREEAAELGHLYGSIEEGDGNLAGIIGELIFVEVLGGTRENTYDYDVLYRDVRVDVKTKRRTVAPAPYYECSIADHNTEQGCDVYYFVSVLKDGTKAWLLGYKDRNDYFAEATFHERGERDPDNGFVFKAACYNLPISELRTSEKGQRLPDRIDI